MTATIQKLFPLAGLGLLLHFALASNGYPQQLQRHKAIAAYIYNFAKNVQWQNESALKEFKFLIIGQDQIVIDEISAISKAKPLRNKPIRVSLATSLQSIDSAQLIFVTKENEKDIVHLFERIEGKNILLVSEGYNDQQYTMINLIDSEKGTILFEINKANIIKQHLSLMDDLILLGGSKVDVAALFHEGQQRLDNMKKYSKVLEDTLKGLEKAISSKSKEMQVQKDSLDRQTEQIQRQQKILSSQLQEFKSREKTLQKQILKTQEQQLLYQNTSHELKKLQRDLLKGSDQLREQQDKIKLQQEEILSQSNILKKQGATINRQRSIVYLLLTIIFLVIILVLTIYKGYKNKQKSNQNLEHKVLERTDELRTLNEQLNIELVERKRAEKDKDKLQTQLLRSQKMEAVGRLAGGVAHDFNNLLTAITGFTSLAMMKLDKSAPVYADLKQVSSAASKAAGVVRQLLLFSRKQPMEPVLIHLNDTIQNLLKIIERIIGEDITIETIFEDGIPAIRGDEGNIEQVLMNLVVNARDAMPGGGKIVMKTENVMIDENFCKCFHVGHPGKYVCISVSDTGTGIDAQALEHIFEPFFTTKEAGKGTGLGLSVVFGIMEQHKGWVNVFSEPGNGATFKVYFPFSIEEHYHKEKETKSLASLKGNGERILLVEDQVEIRILANEILKTNGYLVFAASSAKEAVEIFEKENGRFDIVFSDIVLPDRTGILLVEELLKCGKFSVLLSSGYTDEKANWDFLINNKFHFLQKPYSPYSLLYAVKELLQEKGFNKGKGENIIAAERERA
jgi:signal transduction histidine kinase